MDLKPLRRAIRRTGAKLGIMKDWEAYFSRYGTEQDSGWYDEAFGESDEYQVRYTQSPYYSVWTVIVDRIHKLQAQSVLEIGCGPGQLAEFLFEQQIPNYLGLDFSPKAVEMAKSRVPNFDFVLGDALSSDVYQSFEHQVIVCTEVLEHIEQDLDVVKCFAASKRAICTVPNFPFYSHVRHFEDAAQVAKRYSEFFDDFSVLAFPGIRSDSEKFFIFEGIRKPS